MDSYTSEGAGALKSRYVAGVLTFYRTDGTEIWSINPANGAVAFASAPTFNGGLAFLDNDPLYFGTAKDVKIQWDATNLVVLPLADDTGVFHIGNGTLDMDFRVTLGVAADYVEANVGLKEFGTAGAARVRLLGVSASTNGSVFQAGVSGSELVDDSPNANFMEARFDSGATSGDARGLYLRLNITGVGGGGEALRAFGKVVDVAANTVRGAHISLAFGATGSVSGLGTALETTLHIPTTAGMAGTVSSLKVAINSDGANSDPVGATSISFINIVSQGDSTGMADVDTDAALFAIDGLTEGDVNLWSDVAGTGQDDGANVAGSLRLTIDGVPYYLSLFDTAQS